jgi:N-acetyl sugar amidotransferase
MKKFSFYRCKKCLTTSTRPRISFTDNLCSACVNFEQRKKINWGFRKKQLIKLCNIYRKKDGNYDVVVPVGGGKDSSYVAWMLKNKYKMKPLCVFCEPPLFTKLGAKNLDNFRKSGFDIFQISQTNAQREMDRITFTKLGLPQHNWLASITIAPLKIAEKFNIKIVMWGEEGESMYGGNNKYKNTMFADSNLFKLKLNNISIDKFISNRKSKKLYYWSTLSKHEIKKYAKIKKCHWSYFEKWDETKHLSFAKKNCGLEYDKSRQDNSINNHSHTDQIMFPLHMYLAYLKFGFGRATTDTSIDIRHRRISRKKAIKIVKKFDGIMPKSYISDYCNYFKMTKKNFFKTIHKFINKDIFIVKKKITLLDVI